MDNRWPKVTIKDVCESVIDCVNKTAPVVEYETPYKMIRTTNVKKGVVNLAGARFVEKATFDKWTRRAVPRVGDVILTREAPLGDVGMITTPNENIFLGQRLMQYRVDPEKLDAHYLLYVLQGPKLQGQLKAAGSGSTVEHIRVGDAENLEIELPPILDQREIGKVLANYDNLIENNNRRIAILEEMAQSLYREWFVYFRYPGHANQPDDSFDNKDSKPNLIDSPLGPIPEGWQVKRIKDIGTVNTGKTPSTKKPEYYNSADIPFLKTPDMHGAIFSVDIEDYLSLDGANSQKNKFVSANSICVSCIGARAGVVTITSERLQTNQQINSIVLGDLKFREYIYLFAVSLHQKIHALGSSGATMTNVNKSKFEGIEVIIPPEDVIQAFHSATAPSFDFILNLQKRNKNLKKQRDMLLPKLISGQIYL